MDCGASARAAATCRVGAALAAALALTAAQVLLASALADKPSLREGYRQLLNWDGGWYSGIAATGYVSPPAITPQDTGNVAFFPGYPYAARWLSRATGLSPTTALLVTSQLACVGFWAYLLLLFQRWGIRPRVAATALLVVASHPAAFFLVTAYSESLFLMAAVGFFYWAGAGSRTGLVLAALHGLVMTATRLVGVALVVVPLLQALLDGPAGEALRARCRRLTAPAVVGAVAGLGALLFFVWCRVHFGRWDVYMQTEQAGWGVHANYLAPFRWKTYHVPRPRWEGGYLAPGWLDHLTGPCVFLLLAAFACVERQLARSSADSGWRWRSGLYLGVLLLFYVTVSGRSSLALCGMIRYALPLLVLFVLAATHIVSRVGPPRRTAYLVALLVPWVTIGFVTQLVFTWRFTHWLWVA